MATNNTNTKETWVYSGPAAFEISASTMDLEIDSSGNALDLIVVFTGSDGIEHIWLEGTHYTVSGRTVTTTVSAIGKLTIARNTPTTHDYTFAENEPFPASEFTSAINRLTFMIQAQKEIIDRMLRFPISDGDIQGIALPGANARGQRILSFDDDGNPELVDSLLQESIVSITQESLPGDLIKVTMNFASGASHSFTVPAFGATSTPVSDVYMTNQVVSTDVVIPADKNGFTVGPVSFTGELEIKDGATFVVINEES